jgi:hypothetical protein
MGPEQHRALDTPRIKLSSASRYLKIQGEKFPGFFNRLIGPSNALFELKVRHAPAERQQAYLGRFIQCKVAVVPELAGNQ